MAISYSSSLNLPDNAVWLVTGTSSGIGLSLISSILSHPSYRVVALSRNPTSITLPPTSNSSNTLLQAVDLSSESSISATFDAAIAKFGRIDVVINNAGYGMLGEFESVSIKDGRELFDINLWAPVYITQHALRVMRAINPLNGRIGGVIAQVSSVGGYITAPGQAFYHASKWALEGFSESVAKELDPDWHIRFVVFEPGSVKTLWSGENQKQSGWQHEAYQRPEGKELPLDKFRRMRSSLEKRIGASAQKVADVMVEVVADREGAWGGQELLRLPIGADSWTLIRADVRGMERSLEKWKAVSESTSSGDAKATLRSIGLLNE